MGRYGYYGDYGYGGWAPYVPVAEKRRRAAAKIVAATVYGVGAGLGEMPELLFLLRKANHLDLIAGAKVPKTGAKSAKAKVIDESSLSAVFGIEIETDAGIHAKALPKAPALK